MFLLIYVFCLCQSLGSLKEDAFNMYSINYYGDGYCLLRSVQARDTATGKSSTNKKISHFSKHSYMSCSDLTAVHSRQSV